MARWRKERREKTRGTYWFLLRGKDRGRISVALKYVSEVEVERALAAIQIEEDAGTIARVLKMQKDDPDELVAYLTRDPSLPRILPEPAIDYGGMKLREYYETVYAPWRRDDVRSWRAEATHWRRILRELGALRLREVDARAVADYLDALLVERGRRAGQPAAGNTKRLHRSALQALLMRAERVGHLEQAPDLGRYRIRGSTRVVQTREDPLSLDELVRLMDASSPKHRAMWAVGAGEGLRPSELMRIRWEDVRWTTRTLRICGDEQGEGKTEQSVAEIPLTPLAHRELQAWWLRCGQPTEGAAFLSKRGPYASESGYKKSLASAAKRAGIARPVTPYLLRASFATIAWSVGVEKDVTRRIGRWTDERMLDEVYCRPRPADLVARVAAFDLARE